MAKLYGWLAGLIAILAIVGVIYGKGRLDANHATETAQLTETIELQRKAIEKEQAARQSDAIVASENAKRQAALQTKIGELNQYVETLEDADRECLSGADVERLRDLWR
ncbi:hypothetical protein Lo5R7ANS_46 [Mesorhizobium phage vB_MloP_Lo5R7ANS]|uniref:Uncharacterized protein n=1 Tax=Mesorhizobium phage vB_MloP_Lo5R7ANS TaxID=1527771 RepID=A0A076YQK0_9CAUD|nr:hypothetical protein Lo5R7ANS_46 [Mesorhizobium phage vB_MloP_Lo5R7ANS]AIK68516.1 hypothetical protein Lo5R7ANS_46 [Mesorhizobium phage vB_MloP_Lo5R7ANS]